MSEAQRSLEPTPVSGEKLVTGFDTHSSFCFSSKTRTLRATGPYAEVATRVSLGETIEGARELLTEFARGGLTGATVVGTIPFDPARPARLMVPARLSRGQPLRPVPIGGEHQGVDLAARCEVDVRRNRSQPTFSDYRDAVNVALEQIESGVLKKVVLARKLELSLSGRLDVAALARRVILQNPTAYGFAVNIAERHSTRGGTRILLGASPELLLAKSGSSIKSNPLAGSAARALDPSEDRRRARELMRSAKDLREHRLVTEQVAEGLAPFCSSLSVPREPSLMYTSSMWHLSTHIEGQVRDRGVDSLSLALAIHPTPAVCGAPASVARESIAQAEGFERGFFTGLVGWNDAAGDGEWAICIRCAEAEERSLRLFAGAGIVAGSQPQQELEETQAKLRTILDALGIGIEGSLTGDDNERC